MQFHRDEVDPDTAALFPGRDPAKLSFAELMVVCFDLNKEIFCITHES